MLAFRDFPGIITESDENDLAAGAAIDQLNCTSDEIRVLRSRQGFRSVSFQSDSPAAVTAPKYLFTRGYGNGTFNGTIPLVIGRGYAFNT